MPTDNRIPVPSFIRTINALNLHVLTSPDVETSFEFTRDGEPHDLVGHVLERVGAPIREAAEGRMSPMRPGAVGTPRSQTRFPLLWNRLFLGEEYDARSVIFRKLRTDAQEAENFLVYALLDFVASNGAPTWREAYVKALKAFRRWLNSPTSGFMVQTHGSHEEARQTADLLTAKALAALTQ